MTVLLYMVIVVFNNNILANKLTHSGTTAILFIHGLAGNHTAWKELMNNLPNKSFIYVGNIEICENLIADFIPEKQWIRGYSTDYLCFTMDMSDNQNLMFHEQAREVASAIDKIKNLTGKQKVILIGHSMGGLSARAYINDFGIDNVAGYVSVSTPHLGSFLGEIQNIYFDKNTSQDKKKIIELMFETYGIFGGSLKQDSKVLAELSPCSKALEKLNSSPFPTNIPIDIVVSSYKVEKNSNDILPEYERFQSYAKSVSFLDFKNIIVSINKTIVSKISDYANSSEGCSSKINMFSHNVQNSFTDLVVPVVSQDIRLAVPNGVELSPNYFFSKRFHNNVEKDIPVMHSVLLDITKKVKGIENVVSSSKKIIGLILDSSGSMKENDPNDARIKTIQKIIQMLNGSERVYVVDFDNKAEWLNRNNYDNWNVKQMISQIGNIDSDGGTDIGLALLKMKEVISNTTKGPISGGVILFTDGKGDYNEEVEWFKNNNIPVYTISFTENGDALLLSKIAAETGGQYLLAKNETEAINALDYFFSKLYDFSLFFSETEIIHPNETKWFSFNVDKFTKKLLVSVGWLHSKISFTLVSPSGKEYSKAKNSIGVNFFESDNFASYKIINAEKGEWKAKLYGKEIPKGGERFVFNASGNSPYHINSNIIVDTITGAINFGFNGLSYLSNATVDIEAITPSADTLIIHSKKIINGLTFFPSKGKGNYNFKIKLTAEVNGNPLKRQYYKTVLVGDNISSNIGSVQQVTGTMVKINIGQWAGNLPGLKCYLYDSNNKLIARGVVISVKSKYSIVKISQYYSNSNSSLIKPGYPVKLDYLQWLNDN